MQNLGVTIDQNLKWSKHVKQITNKSTEFMDFYDATYILLAVLCQLKLTVITFL